jgi:hypothetical protein
MGNGLEYRGLAAIAKAVGIDSKKSLQTGGCDGSRLQSNASYFSIAMSSQRLKPRPDHCPLRH